MPNQRDPDKKMFGVYLDSRQREAIHAALRGEESVSVKVVRFSDAAEKMGVTKMTVFNMVKRGLLKPVSAGRSKNIGVTEESLRQLMKGEK